MVDSNFGDHNGLSSNKDIEDFSFSSTVWDWGVFLHGYVFPDWLIEC